MTADGTASNIWSVGEIARQTGLTVRTLHHYDGIGLLVPAQRTRAGHRRYGEADVRRLYRIVALRQLGLGLDEIAGMLDQDGDDLRPTVRRHLERVDRAIAEQEAVRERLRVLLIALENERAPAVADVLDLIERTTMLEKYYTAEQLEQLARCREEFGEDAIRDVEHQWTQLYARVQELYDQGRDPADPDAQALVDRMDELVAMFHGGDEGIKASMRRLWEEQGPQLRAQYGGPPPEVAAYLDRVRSARR
jgi:MerR family transcriptional regulator, thiopeptide resistance regulator